MSVPSENPIKPKKTAVVAGHICLDVLPEMGHLPPGQFGTLFQPGHLVCVGEALFATGGPVSNVGLALHKLGIPTCLVAKTGNDPLGRILQEMIGKIHPDLLDGVRIDDEHPTSYSVIISPPGVDRIFLHCSGVNDSFTAADMDYDLVGKADLMHFGYPPVMQQMFQNEGAELCEVFSRAKEMGVTTSLDMTFPDPASPGGQADWRKILAAVLPWVDIFTPSIEEILFLLNRGRYERLIAEHGGVAAGISEALLSEIGAELLGMGAKIVLLKLGHLGAYLCTAGEGAWGDFGRATPERLEMWASKSLWSACYQVRVVGTTGSGDATIAGFLSAILRDENPYEALNAAVAVGACNVEAPDALSGLCSWERTLERMQSGWGKHELRLRAPGWGWNECYGLWER